MSWGSDIMRDGVADIIVHPPKCGAEERMPDDGKSWEDMPGSGQFIKRCNFFFYRRGMYSLVEMPDGRFFNERSLKAEDRAACANVEQGTSNVELRSAGLDGVVAQSHGEHGEEAA